MRFVMDQRKARWIEGALGILGAMVSIIGPDFLGVRGTILEAEIFVVGLTIVIGGWLFYASNNSRLPSERLQKLEKEMNELREKVGIQKE